jgi:hypothetical protein
MRPSAGQASAELTLFSRRSTTSGTTDREYLCQPEFSLARSFLLGGSGGSSFRGGSLGAGDCSCFVDFSFRHAGQFSNLPASYAIREILYDSALL